MITIRRLLLPLLAFLLLIMPDQSRADGMVFKRPLVADDPWIPDQRALLHWMDGEETLVIETSVNGGGEDLAWVVPLPSVPEVEEAPTGLFPLLAEAFGPKVTVENPWWFPLLVLPALRWWSVRTPRGLGFRLAVVVLLWMTVLAVAFRSHNEQTYFGLMAITFAPLAVLSGTVRPAERPRFIWSALIVGGGLILVMAAFGSYGKIMAGGGGGVRVLGITQAGRFDVTILKAGDADSLADWMKANDFHLPPAAWPAVEAYAREGWVFAAMKVRRDGEQGSGPLHPVTFRFKSDKLVYPMRLTASATQSKPLALDLFVLGPSSASAPGMEAKRSSLTYPDSIADSNPAAAGKETNGNSGRPLAGAPAEIRRWFGGAKVGTWLRGVLPVAQLSEDVLPLWTENSLHDPEATTFAGAINAALNRASLVVIGFFILIRLRRAWRNRDNYWGGPNPGLLKAAGPFLLSVAAVGVFWSLAYGALLDVTSVKRQTLPTQSFHDEKTLKWVHLNAINFSEAVQQSHPEPHRSDRELIEMLRKEVEKHFEDQVYFNEEGRPGESAILFLPGAKGTELWFKAESGARVHLATWDQNGKVDQRPGRIPVWELPKN